MAMGSLEDRCSLPKILVLCIRPEESTAPAASVPHSAAWDSQQDPTPATPQCLTPQPGVKLCFPDQAHGIVCRDLGMDEEKEDLNKEELPISWVARESDTGTQNPILSPRRAVWGPMGDGVGEEAGGDQGELTPNGSPGMGGWW